MYCKMCGNLLGDTDLFCRMCGDEIEERKNTSIKKSESISNPSDNTNDNMTRHDEEEQHKGDKVHQPENKKNNNHEEEEFSWNIYEFPKPRKTEDINFHWGEPQNTSTHQQTTGETVVRKRQEARPVKQEQIQEIQVKEPVYKTQEKVNNTPQNAVHPQEAEYIQPEQTETETEELQQADEYHLNFANNKNFISEQESYHENKVSQEIQPEQLFNPVETQEKAQDFEEKKTIELTKKTIRYKKSKFMEHVLSSGEPIPEDLFDPQDEEEQQELTVDTNDNFLDKEFESQLFADLTGVPPSDISNNEKNDNDFFVFNKKNEEFQRLLDKEYEKIKEHEDQNYKGYEPTPSLNEVMGINALPELEIPQDLLSFAATENLTTTALRKEQQQQDKEDLQQDPPEQETSEKEHILEEVPLQEKSFTETPLASNIDPATLWEDKYAEIDEAHTRTAADQSAQDQMLPTGEKLYAADSSSEIDRSYLDEMAAARESFFAGTPIGQEEDQTLSQAVSAKKKYDTVEIMVNSSQPVKVEVALNKDKTGEKIAADGVKIPITEVVEIQEKEPVEKKWNTEAASPIEKQVKNENNAPANPIEDTPKLAATKEAAKEQKASKTAAAEAESEKEKPDYASIILPYDGLEEDIERRRKKKGLKLTLIIIAVIAVIALVIAGIVQFMPDSKIASFFNRPGSAITKMFGGEKDNQTPNNDDADAADPVNANAGVQSGEPSIYPAEDKTILIKNNENKNVNIEAVKANNELKYEEGRDYGVADINHSTPIKNNIWNMKETGEPIYYDNEIVGTLMAYDSQWIDYVNGGSNAVLELTKSESAAYYNALNFSKVGKVKETFKLLEIGEIRKGENGYYTWCHEEIQVEEAGRVTTNENNWIYFLEPVGDKFQIVNFYKF